MTVMTSTCVLKNLCAQVSSQATACGEEKGKRQAPEERLSTPRLVSGSCSRVNTCHETCLHNDYMSSQHSRSSNRTGFADPRDGGCLQSRVGHVYPPDGGSLQTSDGQSRCEANFEHNCCTCSARVMHSLSRAD